jgi:hypothetical protein
MIGMVVIINIKQQQRLHYDDSGEDAKYSLKMPFATFVWIVTKSV